MSYCTSIHCIDGRIQEPIRKYLTSKYNVKYVDTITEAGPCRILAENQSGCNIDSIHFRIGISLRRHNSNLIAISGHHDCAGNPISDEQHKQQIGESMKHLRDIYPQIEVVGFWINKEWEVTKLSEQGVL